MKEPTLAALREVRASLLEGGESDSSRRKDLRNKIADKKAARLAVASCPEGAISVLDE